MPPKRKSNRRQVVDSDDEGGQEHVIMSPPAVKRPKIEADEDDADVDVDVGSGAASAPTTAAASKPQNTRNGGRGKKRKKATSDEDVEITASDNEYAEDEEMSAVASEDEDFLGDDGGHLKRGRGKGKGSKGKAKGKEPARNAPAKRARAANPQPANAKPKDAPRGVGPSFSVPASSSSAADLLSKDDAASKPAPPKKKLPTIKKTKAPQLGAQTIVVSESSTPVKEQSAPLDPLITPTVARKPVGKTATTAAPDFDLRNKNVYEQLFNAAGGSTPRSGLNLREKEEARRKELHKMRDEARAQREASLKNTFSLQAQTDKISRFDSQLKNFGSWAAYPNVLGAKWRGLYEAEKKEKLESGIPFDENLLWTPPTYYLDQNDVYILREGER